MPGKRVQFDEETWAAIDLLAKDTMGDFQELADEAFRDLLAKHGRPVGLKDQLKRSLRSRAKADGDRGASGTPSPGQKRTSGADDLVPVDGLASHLADRPALTGGVFLCRSGPRDKLLPPVQKFKSRMSL
jgi:hypothetical protein